VKRLSPFIFLISAGALANDSAPANAIRGAVSQLYAESEISDYVCGPGAECTLEEFSRRLEIELVTLRTTSRASDGIAISPKIRGTQYFKALFLFFDGRYKMVLPPDLTSTDVWVTRKSHHGAFDVKTTDRDSRAEWSETTFTFDPERLAYIAHMPRCFALVAGHTLEIECK